MKWQDAKARFLEKHWKEMGDRHFRVMTEYKEHNLSIPGLWSYRGWIWNKYEGRYPTPDEVGLPDGHSFFDPDVVCTCITHFSNGRLPKTEHYHRGRKLKPGHRLYPSPTL